ncbi:uncharacterized protein LOC143030283 [Oratosquilla oratoria]|uniref:uncharacterized protein LOC143030283 n=1 Tax=Oratosquilla oratoria TaxID=337810 RepID=UPI003F766B51
MQRYWWRKIVSDVNETIKTCLRCQKSSTVFRKVDSKLHSIPIKPQIMHQIGIDLCSLTNSSSDPPSPTSLSEPPSPIVQIIGVQQQEIIYKFNPTQRAICNNSGGRLIFKKRSGPSGKINKTFKNTSEPLAVKVIKGDGNCFFRSMAFAITGEEDQHPVVRSLICDFLSTNENIQVDSMREDKVWGTTTEIIAAANMFQVNVCVWAKFGSIHTWHIHSPKGSKIIKDSVYLENNAGNHFNVVIRV